MDAADTHVTVVGCRFMTTYYGVVVVTILLSTFTYLLDDGAILFYLILNPCRLKPGGTAGEALHHRQEQAD
eukprot:22704-Eustigmatos_ZCMA.PRE.1